MAITSQIHIYASVHLFSKILISVKIESHKQWIITLKYSKIEVSLTLFTDKLDEEVVQDGVRVLIDKKAQLSLLGTEMDYVENKLSSEFVFNNPNIKGTCGCGESFSL